GPARPSTDGGDDGGQADAALPSGPLPLDVDPVAIGQTVAGVTRLCDGSIERAKLLLDEVRSLRGAPDDRLTWDDTLGKLDAATLALRNAADFPQLMAAAHPDKAVRDAAKTCDPKVDRFMTGIYLDADLAGIFKRVAARKLKLSGPHGRLLEHTLRDYRRNGVDLPADRQATLRQLNEKITELAQQFDSNIAASTLSIEVTPDQLKGLPDSYVSAHKPGASGKITLTTDYPDYFPFLQFAADRTAAFELYKKFDNRAADKNVAVLDELLRLRHQKATLLGYKTWADYILEVRMAKDAKTVAGFLDGLRQHLRERGREELREFEAMHVKKGGKRGQIPLSDRSYLEELVRQERYGVDSKEVSNYFEIGRVKQGILDITGKLFGLTYRKASGPAWHPDVEPMEVLDKSGKVLGRFYFDLYPRPDKYKHAAVFSIRETHRAGDGGRLMPIAAIVCNFPRPGGDGPALMSHHDVSTFFHEFGHVLHHLLSESELASFAGTAVARDFVEAPSQMLEEWAWSKDTLALFARHHRTGAPLPDALLASMQKARSFGRALSTQRQIFLASLDQAYHTRAPGFDSTKVLAEVQDANMPFKYVPGTHFQATFGHLTGYDAGYYGYQWALSIARDLFTRFEKEGLLSESAAAAYRAAVLAPGGSDDAASLVTTFLGRPPSDQAYRRFLLAR
ncbi:MAG: oligopeptidase A, partial [Myxococcales bacterium]